MKKKSKPWQNKSNIVYGDHSIKVNGKEMRLIDEMNRANQIDQRNDRARNKLRRFRANKARN